MTDHPPDYRETRPSQTPFTKREPFILNAVKWRWFCRLGLGFDPPTGVARGLYAMRVRVGEWGYEGNRESSSLNGYCSGVQSIDADA